MSDETILLNRTEVAKLLALPDCVSAIEEVFRRQGEGELSAPGILGMKGASGGLHVKASRLQDYIVAKLNTNFPENRNHFGRPTIQGLITLFNAENGRPLAVIDSIEITIQRTAAATAVAAKYLARKNSSIATICGCGEQGRAQLRALCLVLPLRKTYAFDINPDAASSFATKLSPELKIDIEPIRVLPQAVRQSDLCVTCTTAKQFFVHREDIVRGTFVAAVGADDAHKQEIDPLLMASAKIVADNLDQVCAIGDTHHAIDAGLMRKENIYAELGEIVAEKKPGRAGDDEIIVFDSTGVAFEDAAAAITVYEKACAMRVGDHFEFAA